MAPIKKSIYIQLKNFPTLYIYSVLPVPFARAREPQLNASRTAFCIPKNNISLPTSFFSPRNDKHMQSFFLLTNNSSKKKRAFQTLFKQKKFENTGCTGCLVFVSTENGTFISKTMALPWRHRFRKVEPQLSCGRINTVNIIWTFNHSLCTYGCLVNFIHEITWFPWPKFP